MDFAIKGKRALVLGGNKGLGRGVALALAAEGVSVAIVGRDEEAMHTTLLEVRRLSPASLGICADLTDPVAIKEMLRQVERELGDVDILLLNGPGPPSFGALVADAAGWRAQFETMFLSGAEIATFLLPRMRANHWGRILVVSSTSAREPIMGLTASNALRAAVAGWAKSLANEVAADGITVNLLLAGRLATDRTHVLDRLDAQARGVKVSVVTSESQAQVPVGRYGTTQEFGAVAAFLASEWASYVTGSAIPIDGGLSRAIV